MRRILLSGCGVPAISLLLAASSACAQAPSTPAAPGAPPSPQGASVPAAKSGSLPPQHVRQRDLDRARHAFLDGAKDIQDKQIAAAVPSFATAARLDPSNPDYDAALAIARDNYATELMQRAIKARLTGQTDLWLDLAKQARSQDPHNSLVLEHSDDMLRDETRPEPDLSPSVDAAPPIALQPSDGKHSFHLYIPRQQLIQQVLSAYGLVASIDDSVTPQRVRFDAEDVTYAQASELLKLATGTFFTPLDPARVLVALDSVENRAKYERLALETVYLPGLVSNELSDVGNVARNVFDIKQVQINESSSTMTLRGPEHSLNAFNYELNELLLGRSEVVLNCDMYDVSHEHTVNVGAQLPGGGTAFNVGSEVENLISSNSSLVQQIIASGLADPGNLEEIALALVLSGQAGSTLLSQPFATFGGGLTLSALQFANGGTANMSLNTSNVEMIDNIKLRLLDQEEGTAKLGERYPIVTSSYSNLATGSTSISGITSAGLSNTLQNLGINLSSLTSAASATVPQVQYQDLGLSLNVTPRIQQNHDVSLRLRLSLTSLAGPTLDGNPVLNSRQVEQQITVHLGEKTVIFSQLTHQETSALLGIPFLSEIPGFNLTTNHDVDKLDSDLVVVITPHIVRLTHTHLNGQMVLLHTHS